MKIEDINAIKQMDTNAHLYLEVVGEGRGQHLTVKHKGFWGRLWMKLGLSSASMENISRYVLQNAEAFSKRDGLEKEKFKIFKQKLSHYTDNHHYARISAQALALLKPKKAFVEQFETSAPRIFPMKGDNKEKFRKLYHAEVGKLETFLRLQNQADHHPSSDLVYICVGHGGVEEQVWPGFIFEALAKNQKVSTLLFEDGWKYPESSKDPWQQMKTELANQSPEMQKAVKARASHFSVQQFLCGLPEKDDEVEEEMDEGMKRLYPLLGNIYWEKRAQVTTVSTLFASYIEKLLKEGKNVVLGAHAGPINSDYSLVEIYNDLVGKYPKQIHFLWGWGGLNLLTHQKISSGDDMRPDVPSPIWTQHKLLKDCYLPS